MTHETAMSMFKRLTPDTVVDAAPNKKKAKTFLNAAIRPLSTKPLSGWTKGGPRVKHWCFTDYEDLNWNAVFNRGDLQYLIVGKETGNKKDKPHLQGYAQFFTRRQRHTVKIALGSPQIHVEPCRGSPMENYNYCAKEGSFKEWGKMRDPQKYQRLYEDQMASFDRAILEETERLHRIEQETGKPITAETAAIKEQEKTQETGEEKTLTSSTKTGLTRNNCIAETPDVVNVFED